MSLNKNDQNTKPARQNEDETQPGLMSREAFAAFANPAFTAFVESMKELEKNPTADNLANVHMAMLIDGAQQDSKIIALLPHLYKYLDHPSLYFDLSVLLSDISHLNANIVNSMLEYGIFDHLDYEKDISFSLVFAICDSNPTAWNIWSEKYLGTGLENNKQIQQLINNFNN